MKPALIKKWIDSLFPPQDDLTRNTTTNSIPGKTLSSLQETAHRSSISSPRLLSRKSSQLKESVGPLENQGQHSGSAQGRHGHRARDTEPLQRPRAKFGKGKEPKVQAQGSQIGDLVAPQQEVLLGSSPLGSHIKSESTRETLDDSAIPSQLNLRLHDCELCDLLWLRPNIEGQNVPGTRHPTHHTHYDSAGATTRSLVVFIAAVCLPEGHQYFKPAGVGVFFNKYSTSNVSYAFNMTHELESSRSGARGLVPHLVAARNALQAVRTEIVPARIHTIREIALRNDWTEVDVQAVARFHLIVATDSQALLDEICSWKSSNQLRSSLDVDLSRDKDSLVDLLDQIEALSGLGIQVVWSLVSERWNRPAKKLAADAVIGHCSRLDGKKPSRIARSLQAWRQKTRGSDRGESRFPVVQPIQRLPSYIF
jgi:hypothetical protein